MGMGAMVYVVVFGLIMALFFEGVLKGFDDEK
jgi:hypothetical protein